jgi:single-strand DNA-binding protein
VSNEAAFSVSGYVATLPFRAQTKAGEQMVTMRIGWTPRSFDRGIGDWKDQPTSFASVVCFRKLAENAYACLRKGDPIVVRGTLRIREYEDKNGARRATADIVADSIGHDLAKGISSFTKSRPPSGETAQERDLEGVGGRAMAEDGPGEDLIDEATLGAADFEAFAAAGDELPAPV